LRSHWTVYCLAIILDLFLGRRKAMREGGLPYQEGDWLWIPLRLSGLCAVARVARIGPKGRVIAIYGFGPARTSKPSDEELGVLEPESADLLAMCGDLGIINGAWQVIPYEGHFVRKHWPMPSFGQWYEGASFGIRLDYVEDAPNTNPVSSRVPLEDARQLPRDGVSGYEALEFHFCQALEVPANEDRATIDPKPARADHYVYFRSERIAKSAASQMLKAVPRAATEIRKSDDSWLVVLSHGLVPAPIDFDEIIDRLKRIAAQRGGDYDGWERDT
jgi:hypothetical protein